MPGDDGGFIFISHSSRDRQIAQAIASALERRGLRCWISSRDIGPGENFQEAIVHAIRGSQAMVLVFTGNANNSNEIKKEMAIASQHNLAVIPIRVEDVVPNDAFVYEFATRQWIDAFDNWDHAVERLAQQAGTVAKGKIATASAASTPATPLSVPRSATRRPSFVIGAIALLVCVVVAVGVGYIMGHAPPPAAQQVAAPQPSAPASSPQVAAVTPPVAPVPPSVTAGAMFRDCTDCPEMVVIPAGTFLMGSHNPPVNEQPIHRVTVAAPFAIGKSHVTRGEYAHFVEATSYGAVGCAIRRGDTWSLSPQLSWRDPGFPQTDRDPVVCVSWNDADAYVTWLARSTGKPYRLPTEAEWEYAARAGTTTRFYWGDDVSLVCRYENVQDESWTEKFGGTASIPCRDGYAYTSPVGTYQPNSFGLYDMLGNAFEWVEDCWSDDYAGASSDASIAMTLTGDCARLARGGSWNLSPLAVRSSLRFRDAIGRAGQIIGFRVALTLADQSLRPTH